MFINLGAMTRKIDYAVPKCQQLDLELEEGFLAGSSITGGPASAEDVTVENGEWDD